MSPPVVKALATPIILALHIAVGVLVIGIAQQEFGATKSGIEYPYGLVVLLTVGPLLASVWASGARLWRRIAAWAVGSIATVAVFTPLRSVALKSYSWDALYGNPLSLAAAWPVLAAIVGSLIVGIMAARLVLRRGRSTASEDAPA